MKQKLSLVMTILAVLFVVTPLNASANEVIQNEPEPYLCTHPTTVRELDEDHPGAVFYRCTECGEIVSMISSITSDDAAIDVSDKEDEPQPYLCTHQTTVTEIDEKYPGFVFYRCTECGGVVSMIADATYIDDGTTIDVPDKEDETDDAATDTKESSVACSHLSVKTVETTEPYDCGGVTTITQVVCEDCGEVLSEERNSRIGDKHTYGNGEIIKDPSGINTADGVISYTCTVCGEKKTQFFSIAEQEKEKDEQTADFHVNINMGSVTKETKEQINSNTQSKEATNQTASTNTSTTTQKTVITSINTSPESKTSVKKDTKKKSTKKKITIKKKSGKGKSFTVTFTGEKKPDGYEIQYATNKSLKNAKVKRTKKTSISIKELKSKKVYYVRVRAYTKNGKTKTYGEWSKAQKLK